MKNFLLFTILLLATVCAFAQNYTVGVQSVTWTDASRSNRSVPVEFHYPGTNTAIASDSFGFVVFGHGFDMTIDAYYNYADSLATHGYIVALTSNEGGLSPSHPNLAQDLIYIYNMMISESNTDAASPLYHHVKAKGAIAGHSMGGGCTVLSCQYSDTATCYWTLAEATTTPSSVTAAPFMHKPYLSFAGSSDCIAPATTNQIPTYDSSGSICKTLVEIKNATHCQFALSNVACNFGEGVSGCASTTLSRNGQTDTVLSFLYPYLDYYLNGNCAAWTKFESLYSADVNDVLMQSCNNIIPTNQSITGATSFCSGHNDLLTAAPVGFSYTWSNNSTGSTLSVSNAGTYSLTVSNGTCSVTAAPFTVAENTAPATPSVITAPDTVCSGITNITISVINDPAATTYNWSLPSGWNITNGSSSHAIQATSGNTGGTISVTAQNSCGVSSSIQKNIIVTLSGLAAPGAIRGDSAPCVGQPVQYVISAVSGATSYVWNYPAGWTLNSGNTSDSLNLTSGNGAGTVTVQAVNGCGQGTPSSLNVTALSAPVINAIAGDTLVCTAQPVQYIAGSTTGATGFLWNYPSGWTLVSGGNADTLNLTAGSSPGNVTVQVSNGCGQSSVTSLSVNTHAAPVVGAITGTDSVCINSTGALSFNLPNISGADSIYWSAPVGWSLISGQGTANVQANNNGIAGAINATAFNVCGSANATPLNLNVIDTPTALITQHRDTLTTGLADKYQWYLNGTEITGATSQNYITSQNGNYTVAVTNAGNCTGMSPAYNYIYLSINQVSSQNDVAIFPNPSANGIFQLMVSNDLQGGTIQVFDVLGRLVFEKAITEPNPGIDLSLMSKGIYQAVIGFNSGFVKKSLVIE